MLQRFRILPLLILVAAAMLTLKLGTIWQDIAGLNASLNARRAAAADDAAGSVAKAPEAPPAESQTTRQGLPTAEQQPPAELPSAAPPAGDDSFDPRELSQSEIRLLQALADRRKALDTREFALNQREALLKAAEQRILDRQASLIAMRTEVKTLLGQLDEQEKTRIGNLVKLYENMKPKEAAHILNDLELPVMLGVVQRMNVRKLAPVLAAMDADKARAVTRALASREKSQEALAGRVKESLAEAK
jgi:flagellar motility protein MotE (MotC chaperone)